MSSALFGSIDPSTRYLLNEDPKSPSGFLDHFSSLTLESKGSVARDHMANERTFLAWLRTSLSLATVGIGIVQLFKLKNLGESEEVGRLGKPIGVAFIITGIYTLVQGFFRYYRVQSLLISSFYPVSQWSIGSVNVLVFLLVLVTLLIVLITT